MARIKIRDLPKDIKIPKQDLRKVRGGVRIIPDFGDGIIDDPNAPTSGSFPNKSKQDLPGDQDSGIKPPPGVT